MYNNIENDNTNIEYNKIGGNVLASGGFGCVFMPALKCKEKSKNKNTSTKLSKLMIDKYATQEYDKISFIREKLKDISNYKDYFLLDDFSICNPAKLSKSDLSNYSKKCRALKKHKIYKENINQKLDKLLILSMPYGGVPVDDYIEKYVSYANFLKINNLLISLLKNGIIPMNNEHIYHCDIKDSNVLIDTDDNDITRMRLIDWGISIEYIPFKDNQFPKSWRNKPLQFNMPFSVILFTDDFVKKYTEYIENGGILEKKELEPFVFDYIKYWFKERGIGHYKYINELMYYLFSNEVFDIDNDMNEDDKLKWIEQKITMPYIINYIVEVLIHFTKFREDGTLNMREYLDKVFIRIADIWGFINIYNSILHIFSSNYYDLTARQLKIFNTLKHIYLEYLYKPRIEPIPISELEEKLRTLTNLFNLKKELKKTKQTKKYLSKRNITNKIKKTKRFKSF
jgi:serine/threonine protein kinase